MAKLKVMNSTMGFSPDSAPRHAEAGKAVFGDRRIDHAAWARTPAAVLA